MIEFGKKDNELIDSSIFLEKSEENDVGIKYIIKIKKQEKVEFYEIMFEDYIIHRTMDESFYLWDNHEIRKGYAFLIFERSRLLDDLSNIVNLPMIVDFMKKDYKHYGIYCENHTIDIISFSEPKINLLNL